MIMSTCVVVADGARARFFILQSAKSPVLESGPNLVEVRDFINPESDERGQDLWSETKTGLGRSPAGGYAHSYDDHREDHEAEFERRFVRKVAEESRFLVQSQKAKELVVVAPKKLLGVLRPALDRTLKQQV